MKLKYLLGAALASVLAFASCEDDLSTIGGSLTSGEVTITVDSLALSVDAVSVYTDTIDARSLTKLLGRINIPQYGSLDCSFVSQMLCATYMDVPDSITTEELDSMRLVFSVPVGSLTGDSLTPQQLRVYELTKQLPSSITSEFDPTGYYDSSSLMGEKSYTLSNIQYSDSLMQTMDNVRIDVPISMDFCRKLFEMYREEDPVFQWPSTFNEFFPGIYVEQNFGNGCIANISKAEFFTYWHRTTQEYEMLEDSTYGYVDYIVRDSVCLMASQPEVISSNIVKMNISDNIRQMAEAGKAVITTPGGYTVDFTFPLQYVLDSYLQNGDLLSVVSSLAIQIPASVIDNDYGLGAAPYLLLIKKCDAESFFADNLLPDSQTSFYASYDSSEGIYSFTSMRAYFLDMLEKYRNGGEIDPDDITFSLIPVSITMETVSSYYSSAVYVTKVSPYIAKPTMTELDMDNLILTFIYSTQEIE